MDDPSKIKFTIPQDINNMNKVNPQQNQFLMNNQFNFQNFQNNSPNLQNNIPNNINNPLPNNVQKFPNNLNINMCNPSNIDNLKNIMAQINNINPNQNNLFGKMFEPQKTQNFIPNIKNDLDFLLNQNKPNHENQNNNFLDNMFSENLFSDNQMNNLNNVNNQPSNLNINFDTNNNNNTNTNNNNNNENQKGMEELQKQIKTMQMCNNLQKKSLDVLYQYIGQFYKEVDYHQQINEFQKNLMRGNFFMNNNNQINYFKQINQIQNQNQNTNLNNIENQNPMFNQTNNNNLNNLDNPIFNQFNH